MRISNNLIQSRLLSDLQGNLSRIAQAQSQVSTGNRFERMSEDPLAGSQVMTADRGLRGLAQYRRNSAAARTRTDAEEAVLNQLTDLLTRAKELATQEGSSTSTPLTRSAVAAEVQGILDQTVHLGNTQVGSEYLFAGHQTARPFDPAGGYSGDDGVRQAEIGQDQRMTTNHTGRELLLDSGVVSGLRSLLTELTSGTSGTVAGTITGIDGAFAEVQTMLATTGARARQIDSAMQNADAIDSSLTLARSAARDIPLEQASIQLASGQNALQAALLAASRILNTSLTDYLR